MKRGKPFATLDVVETSVVVEALRGELALIDRRDPQGERTAELRASTAALHARLSGKLQDWKSGVTANVDRLLASRPAA